MRVTNIFGSENLVSIKGNIKLRKSIVGWHRKIMGTKEVIVGGRGLAQNKRKSRIE